MAQRLGTLVVLAASAAATAEGQAVQIPGRGLRRSAVPADVAEGQARELQTSALGSWSSSISYSQGVEAGRENGTPNYVCRWPTADGGVAGKRNGFYGSSCNVAVNATEYSGAGSQLLTNHPLFAWSATIPAGAVLVSAGGYRSRQSFVCRAVHPDNGSGPHAGTTTAAANGPFGAMCLIPYGGKSIATLEFQYLVRMSATAGPSEWSSVVPVNPSPSATPTATPTPSASASAAVPGVATWMPATGAGSNPYAVVAGAEGSNTIYVCAGALPGGGEAIVGKYESVWSACDIPVNETEQIDRTYTLLRASPWMVWAQAAPVRATQGAPASFTAPSAIAGALPVAGTGTFMGRVPIVCRAWHPTQRTGPHSGYTDGVTTGPDGGVACLFSWGGGVVHATVFDVLFAAPASMSAAQVDAARPSVPVAPRVPTPSSTPSPSRSPIPSASSTPAVPGRASWVSASTRDGTPVAVGANPSQYVLAGSEFGGNGIFVCRGRMPSGDVVPGKWETLWQFCDIDVDDSEANDAEYELLQRSPWLAWSRPASVPAGSNPVNGSVKGASASVCRAYHPPTRSGPHPGYATSQLWNVARGTPCNGSTATGTTMQFVLPGANSSSATSGASASTTTSNCVPVCVITYGGSAVRVAEYDVLVLLPSSWPAAQAAAWNGSAPLALPLPTPSPTPSPSPSPSMAPAPWGVNQWLRGTSDPLNTNFDAVYAGSEGAHTLGFGIGSAVVPLIDRIFVCRGRLPTGELVAGKYHAGWIFCDIPIRGVEVPDLDYDVLRPNPAHAWVHVNGSALPRLPAGAAIVSAGGYQGLQSYVCRAMHPTLRTGPHSGYTDGEDYNGSPLCFFSYGGHIVRTAPFDVLVTLPQPSATPTQTPSGTASRTASPSPTRSPVSITSSPTASGTPAPASPSNTPTASVTASPTSTSTLTATATRTPSRASSLSRTSTNTGTATGTLTATPSGSDTPSPSSAPVDGGAGGGGDGYSGGGDGYNGGGGDGGDNANGGNGGGGGDSYSWPSYSPRPAESSGSNSPPAAAPSSTTTTVVVAIVVVGVVGLGYLSIRKKRTTGATQLVDEPAATASEAEEAAKRSSAAPAGSGAEGDRVSIARAGPADATA